MKKFLTALEQFVYMQNAKKALPEYADMMGIDTRVIGAPEGMIMTIPILIASPPASWPTDQVVPPIETEVVLMREYRGWHFGYSPRQDILLVWIPEEGGK